MRMFRRGWLRAAAVLLGAGATAATLTLPTGSADAATTGCGRSPDPAYTHCALYDGFGGTSLNTRHWTKTLSRNTGSMTGGDCFYGADVRVSQGALNLTSKTLRSTTTCKLPGSSSRKTRFVGAEVTTLGKFAQKYGVVEYRAAYPAVSKDNHAALWQYPTKNYYGAWPHSGEVDVDERVPWAANTAVQSLHYVDLSDAVSYLTGDKNPGQTTYKCHVSTPHAYHVYGADWTPTTVRFFVDGRTCATMHWSPFDLVAPAPFDKPFFEIATQVNIGNSTTRPGTRVTKVDWAKVWTSPTA